MSDVPFLALALAGIWLAERSLGPKGSGSAEALWAGLLVGLSVGFRSLGIPIAAGIGLLMLSKRRYRNLIWFSALGLPFALIWSWPAISALLRGTTTVGGLSTQEILKSGWTQTLCYYSSYACNWREGIASLASVFAVVRVNLTVASTQPGLYLLSPFATHGTSLRLVLVVFASVLSYLGIVKRWRRFGWSPIYAGLLCYLAVVIPFPYGVQRYLLLFIPLFFGGLWVESRHLGSLLLRGVRRGNPRSQRAVAGLLACVGLLLTGAVLLNYIYSIPVGLRKLGTEHEEILNAEMGAYRWIREHTAPAARIIAFEDGLTYLHTGRQTIWPIAPLPESFFQDDPRFAHHDADHLADVAVHIGASYWLVSPYDKNFGEPGGFSIVQARQKSLLADAQLVYRDPRGLVSLYDVRHLVDIAKHRGAVSPQPEKIRNSRPKN